MLAQIGGTTRQQYQKEQDQQRNLSHGFSLVTAKQCLNTIYTVGQMSGLKRILEFDRTGKYLFWRVNIILNLFENLFSVSIITKN